MVLFNNIPYKRMHLTSKVNLIERFSEKYKRMRLTTRLYGMVTCSLVWLPSLPQVLLHLLYTRSYLVFYIPQSLCTAYLACLYHSLLSFPIAVYLVCLSCLLYLCPIAWNL